MRFGETRKQAGRATGTGSGEHLPILSYPAALSLPAETPCRAGDGHADAGRDHGVFDRRRAAARRQGIAPASRATTVDTQPSLPRPFLRGSEVQSSVVRRATSGTSAGGIG